MSRALMSRALRSKGVDEMPLIDEQPLMSSQNIYIYIYIYILMSSG